MNKTILIVAAHAAEVLDCFGTVARLIKEGFTAYTLILGEGKTSRYRQEQELLHNKAIEVNKIIGIKKIETVIREVKPRIISTHYER